MRIQPCTPTLYTNHTMHPHSNTKITIIHTLFILLFTIYKKHYSIIIFFISLFQITNLTNLTKYKPIFTFYIFYFIYAPNAHPTFAPICAPICAPHAHPMRTPHAHPYTLYTNIYHVHQQQEMSDKTRNESHSKTTPLLISPILIYYFNKKLKYLPYTNLLQKIQLIYINNGTRKIYSNQKRS
jgi:dolichol kinase